MRIILFIFLLSFSFSTLSQNTIIVQSDRPGIGYNANTVGKGIVLHQVGYQFSQDKYQYYHTDLHDISSNLRIGLLKNLEVHWNFNYNFNRTTIDSVPENVYTGGIDTMLNYGISTTAFGLRYTFLKGKGWKPTMALMGDFETPLIAHSYQYYGISSQYQNTPTGSVLLITNFNYDNGFFWGLTTGIQKIARQNIIPYALSVGTNIGNRWSVFGELYGNYNGITNDPYDQIWTTGFDMGLTFQLHPNLILDLYGGAHNISGYRTQQDYGFFVSSGLTWAIQAWHKNK